MPKGELLMRGSFNVIVQNNRVSSNIPSVEISLLSKVASQQEKQCYWVWPLLMKILDRKAV